MDQVYQLATRSTGQAPKTGSRANRSRVAPMALCCAEGHCEITGPVARSLAHADRLQREISRLQLCVDDFVSAAPGGPWDARAMASGTDSEPTSSSRGLPMAVHAL